MGKLGARRQGRDGHAVSVELGALEVSWECISSQGMDAL